MSSEWKENFGADSSGKSYYAATRTELTLACRAQLEAGRLVSEWQKQLGCEWRTCGIVSALHVLIR